MVHGSCKEEPLLSTPQRSLSFSSCQGFPECQGDPGSREELAKKHPEHVGKADLRVAVSNVVLSVLGAGQLTLPYALSQLGLTFGVVCLVVFALLSVYPRSLCRAADLNGVGLASSPSALHPP
ncbi:unnamed protein product [Prorocentrum cordatum]|uniref:Amino acid transporter transmembrane domain-containing protein n=1 Tax=Prorocentrum cordatum TaxID=2364126 RepID=A0ABN9Q6G6_9DINO|nr:unnamed protein product [Polarella glacialis]